MSKDTPQAFHLVIPAAGHGARTGLDTPKQYMRLGGYSVLHHAILPFLSLQGLKTVTVAIDPQAEALYHACIRALTADSSTAAALLRPPVHGGATRQESVARALASLRATAGDDDILLIHDAARPFITADLVRSLLDVMEGGNHAAATLSIPVADTLVSADENYRPADRRALRAVQTPQAFRYGAILGAHETYAHDNRFTDDAGLIAATGAAVRHVEGDPANTKITTSGDIAMANRIFAGARETRTGTGFDVHAFADCGPAENIRIGGIDIPYHRSLVGHSDADVALHALTDALLGAMAEGDIGQIFPPSDPQWKGANSDIFLKHAVELLGVRGGTIIHTDITLLCEEPKIGPHRIAMQKRIADILGIAVGRVSVKASTTEKLGFTGRGEGIAAQAAATISLPLHESDKIG